MERLSRQDVSNLTIEARGLPMHMAGLAVLEGSPLRDADGVIRLEAVRAAVGARLHMAPRLRQVLYRPAFGLGLPMWVDDAGFDIAEHVMVRAVPAPGDMAAVLAACQELNERPLDRSRPLWEMWLLTGISDGTVGMLIRLHHAIADGIATLGLLGSLFDFAPDAPAPVAAGPWIAAPAPSTRELLADAWGRRRAGLDRILTGLAHPGRLLRRLGAIGPLVQEALGEGLAPRSSLNGPIGTRHRLLIVRADLRRAKAVARARSEGQRRRPHRGGGRCAVGHGGVGHRAPPVAGLHPRGPRRLPRR